MLVPPSSSEAPGSRFILVEPGPLAFRLVLDFVQFPYLVATCFDCMSVSIWGPGGHNHLLQGHSAAVLGM